MNTNKLYTVCGTSVKNGVMKVRHANELALRIKMLTADKQTNIVLIELPMAMSKVDAARYIVTHESFTSLEQQLTINNYLNDEKAPVIIAKTPDVVVADESNATVLQTAEDLNVEQIEAKLTYDLPELESDDDYNDILEIAGYNEQETFALDDY
jgi:hypothetical protein